MDNRQRLKVIELTLTPYQSVLLWMNNARKGTFEDGARTFPRTALANSILKTVTASMKGQTPEVVERAVLQARQEADLLYNIIVDLNAETLTSFFERSREFQFLARYLRAIRYSSIDQNFEKDLRATVLFFAEKVLLWDSAISQISTEQFAGQSLLFPDTASKLREQLDLANLAVEYFNHFAQKLDFAPLTAESIRDKLRPEVNRQVSCRRSIARIKMLSDFGDETELIAVFDQFIRTEGNRLPDSIAVR